MTYDINNLRYSIPYIVVLYLLYRRSPKITYDIVGFIRYQAIVELLYHSFGYNIVGNYDIGTYDIVENYDIGDGKVPDGTTTSS